VKLGVRPTGRTPNPAEREQEKLQTFPVREPDQLRPAPSLYRGLKLSLAPPDRALAQGFLFARVKLELP
jgi:hypothetical protein